MTKGVTQYLKAKDLLKLSNARTVSNRKNPIPFRETVLWNGMPDEQKLNQSVTSYKMKIKEKLRGECKCIIYI